MSFLPLSKYLVAVRINKLFHKRLVPGLLPLLHTKFSFFNHHTLLDRQVSAQYFVYRFPFQGSTWLVSDICFRGSLDIVEAFFLRYPNPRLWKHAISNACLGGHLPVLKYLHENGVPLHDGCWLAAERGFFDLMSYLHVHKCPFHHNSFAQAACYGLDKVVVWFIAQGYITEPEWCLIALERTRSEEHRAVKRQISQHYQKLFRLK